MNTRVSMVQCLQSLIEIQEELQRIDDTVSPMADTEYSYKLFDLKNELDELCKTFGLTRKGLRNL